MVENKVVLIGDCHNNFEKLDEILTTEMPFNFFLSTGDIGELDKITLNDLKIIDKWKNKGFQVFGNHDQVKFFPQLTLSQEINGLHICGLNGIIRSRDFIRDTKSNISFREILYLSHLKDVDILVTHQPPTGIFNGMGEVVLEDLTNYLVPKIHMFSHVHKQKTKFRLRTFCISLPLITRGYSVAYFRDKELVNLEIVFKKGKRIIRV